ncbi:hypothetical protein DLREEDagrD3_24990 [Denitratisoma sp. agr-D3]
MSLFSRTLPKRLARLKGMPLFSTLDARELRIVDGMLHEREYLDGEVIFDQGEEGQAIYLVFEGRVSIRHHGAEEEDFIAELEAGTFFGEQALLNNAVRAAQVRASGRCLLGVMFRTDFHSLLASDARVASKIALQLARHLSRRLRDMVESRDHGKDHL